MNRATLHRRPPTDQGTFGMLFDPEGSGFICFILELPWRENKVNISCIPDGEYECQFIHSNHFGPAYWVRGVPGRSGILFHAGNVAGDQAKGYRTHSAGCLLTGSYTGALYNQKAVLASRKARGLFLDHFGQQPFILTIKEQE